MASKVWILPTALQELDQIVSFLSSRGSQTALKFKQEWNSMIENLETGLVTYRVARQEILEKLDYRTVFVGDYIVLYFANDNDIEIAHVLRQTSDYASYVIHGS